MLHSKVLHAFWVIFEFGEEIEDGFANGLRIRVKLRQKHNVEGQDSFPKHTMLRHDAYELQFRDFSFFVLFFCEFKHVAAG